MAYRVVMGLLGLSWGTSVSRVIRRTDSTTAIATECLSVRIALGALFGFVHTTPKMDSISVTPRMLGHWACTPTKVNHAVYPPSA